MMETKVMKNNVSRGFLLVLMFVGISPIYAGEAFVVEVPVVSAEPQYQMQKSEQIAPECLQGKPETQSLVTLLNWDLGKGHCRQVIEHQMIQGYRVSYTWRGETRSMLLPHPPGETVSLKVSVR